MFDVGFSEILIIAVIALVFLGPDRLPHAARFAGLWVRRARAQWASVRAELERELELERVRADLDAASASMQAPMRELDAALRETEAELASMNSAPAAAPPPPRDPPAAP
jgi:sec-independent protein translocase protein TatB